MPVGATVRSTVCPIFVVGLAGSWCENDKIIAWQAEFSDLTPLVKQQLIQPLDTSTKYPKGPTDTQ